MGRLSWKSFQNFSLSPGQKPYPYRRKLVLASLGITLFLTVFSVMAISVINGLTKEVTVILNGVEEKIKTDKGTVEELLTELQVDVKAHDYIYPDLKTKLTSGMLVTWKPAVVVTLQLYGEEKKVWTTASTVEELLKEQKLTLQPGDRLTPEKGAKIRPQLDIELAHYREELVTEEEVIPYQTIRRHDATLLKGEQKVVTKGQDGKAVHTYKVTYKNDQEIARELVSTEVVQQRRDELVAIGTKTIVSRGNYTFTPKSVLENVTLTAYSAGEEHTGKTPDHPQYGLTRSGTRAVEGQTIAVDPRLIPLGSWVYIDGIGLRRAEDTGSAVKGKKIDLYFEDSEEAKQFGVKKGYKVYVIGKQKPEAK